MFYPGFTLAAPLPTPKKEGSERQKRKIPEGEKV